MEKIRIEPVSGKRMAEITENAAHLVKGKVSLISAFCPSANVPGEAEKTVKSFLATRHDVEIILVDNECPKNTMDAIGSAVGPDPRVKIVTNTRNLGYSGGFNTGIRACSTEVYIFMQNDRWLDPDCVDAICNDMSLGLFCEVFFTKDVVEEIDNRFWLVGQCAEREGFARLRHYCRFGDGLMDENMFFIPADTDYNVALAMAGFDKFELLKDPGIRSRRKDFGKGYSIASSTNAKSIPDTYFEQFVHTATGTGWDYFRMKWRFITEHFDVAPAVTEKFGQYWR